MPVGYVYPKVNFMLASFVISVPAAIATLSVPLSQSLSHLLISFAVYGFCFGIYEAGCGVFILQLWRKSSSPFLQTLEFMFGFGSLIAPLIARPFLSVDTVDQEYTGSLMFPYAALAGLILINAVFFFVTWYMFPVADADVPSCELDDEKTLTSEGQLTDTLLAGNQSSRKRWKFLTIGLTFLFMHIFLGLEVAFGSFIMTFAVTSQLHISKDTGALLTTLFWGTFTFAKLAAIFTVQWIGNEGTIFLSLILMLIANVILLPFGQESQVLLFLGVAVMGTALASIFGCIFGFLDSYMIVTSTIGSGIVLSATLGEVTFPGILSLFIDSNPMILMWLSLACSGSQAILFLIVSLICRLKLKSK